MEEDILKKLAELETKIDAVYKSAEKTRKYFLWTIIGSIALVVLPLIALMFIIPQLIDTISGGATGINTDLFQ